MNLLDELSRVDWTVAVRTYGNDHATLIGLIVAWWNKLDENHWVIESGPSCGRGPEGKAGGNCDALLSDRSGPAVVLEVEGSRHRHTLEKIGHFFEGRYPELKTLRAGLFVGYTWQAGPAPFDEFVTIGEQLTAKHPGRLLVVVAIEKGHDVLASGIRNRNDYYRAAVRRISAVEIRDGRRGACRSYYQSKACIR